MVGRFSFLRFLRSTAFLPSASAEGFLFDSFGVDEALSDRRGDDGRDVSPPSLPSPVEGEGVIVLRSVSFAAASRSSSSWSWRAMAS